MMSRRVALLLVLSPVVALVVAACGGGGATATPVPPTATTRPAPTAAPPTATSAPAPVATAAPVPTATRPPAPTATPAGPAPKIGGTFQPRWYVDSRNWDVWHAAGGFNTGFVKNMMSNLVQFRPGTFEIAEDLATTWNTSADGKVLTFGIRKDASWHDGKPVTARDVMYTFNRGNDPAFNFNKSRVRLIEKMETPDDSTLKVTLSSVSNSFLANVAGAFMLIYPSHITDMAVWQKNPVGSGPFVLKSDKPDVAYDFTKNPKYYRKDAAGTTLPYLDAITFNVIVDPQLSLSAFRSGRIHCGCIFDQNWTNANIEALRRDIPGLKEGVAVGGVRSLYFNAKKAPFNNAALRQAVAIGLDKEAVTSTYEGGKQNYGPAPFLVPPELGGQWGLPKAELQKFPGLNPNHAADTALAKQKFKEAGVEPSSLNIRLLGSNFYKPLGDLLASVLISDLGIKTSVDSPASTIEINQQRLSGNFDILMIADSQSIDDPSDRFSEYIITGGADNLAGYSNPRVDDLMAQQDREQDPAKRRQMLWDIQRVLLTETPMMPLFFIKNVRALRPEVNNYKAGPLHIQNFDFSEIWLDK